MHRTASDACLFIGNGVMALMHVDDFQILSPSKSKIDWLINGMRKKYNIKTVETNLFLGLHIISKDPEDIKLSQEHYSREKLQGHGLQQAKSVKYPLDRLYDYSDEKPCKQRYGLLNKIIGELQHLANHTRPDINHAVNHLARLLQNPSSEHVTAAKHIWRYIAGPIDQGLVYKRLDNMNLEVYSDSDFAGDPSTSRSTSGSLIKICGAPAVWRSRLQKEVVLSSTDAEYLALTETTREVSWLRNLLNELHQAGFLAQETKKVLIHVDNQSAISLVRNHTNSRRSRHVSLRSHYCREQHETGKIEVEYTNTKEQLADGLTKPMSPNRIL